MSGEHEPTKETRELVKGFTHFGVTQEQVAQYIGITSKTLRKHYRPELDQSLVMSNFKIARKLHETAMEGDVTAMIFWLKTKGGFTTQHQQDVAPITIHNIMPVPSATSAEDWEAAATAQQSELLSKDA